MILLINPKTSKSVEVQKEFFREPNLGILYLAAVLDSNNIPVDILDLEQYLDFEKIELKKGEITHICFIFCAETLTKETRYGNSLRSSLNQKQWKKVLPGFHDAHLFIQCKIKGDRSIHPMCSMKSGA